MAEDSNKDKNQPLRPKIHKLNIAVEKDVEENAGEQFKNIYLNLLGRSRNKNDEASVSSLASVLREEAMMQANNSYNSMMEIRESLQKAYKEVVNLQTSSKT